MTELQGRFAANHADVAAKVIDGELIIIRLSDGTYYSMDSVGAHAWELIAGGHDVSSLVRTIADSYDAPADRVERDMTALVQQLLSERLIVAAENGGAVAPPASDPPGSPSAYATPELNVYRDMGNLLALDPPTPGIDELLLRDETGG